jgi:hypothetical protein
VRVFVGDYFETIPSQIPEEFWLADMALGRHFVALNEYASHSSLDPPNRSTSDRKQVNLVAGGATAGLVHFMPFFRILHPP